MLSSKRNHIHMKEKQKKEENRERTRMSRNRRQRLDVLALCLLLICVVQSDAGDIRPLNHGLSNETDPGDPSPAMAAFFGARPSAPLPAERNTTDPVWGVAGKVSPAKPDSDNRQRRTLLLIAGVACGILGVGLLVSAAAYTVRTRRTGHPAGLRTGFGPASWAGPTRWKSKRETRLGPA
ncbi:hypothetical protein IEQ34_010934 [Dendrobium chrysotoxum]|uniref:Transmembrane protein n=1 Tax=Dendrobium chrysotoxum TaxID=161865 RepID=A0AAV7GU87_DENCH|nr:hypothetical protein IEQ34_010934 [Dendrobium chrysotoxum]